MDTERVGTHFTNCWKDGGYRHYACAVAEAERQREAIRNAPHAYLCASGRVSDKGLTSEQYRARYAAACDCWKRDALGEEDAQ